MTRVRILRALMVLGGIAAVLIGLTHVILGTRWIPGAVPVNATLDSEHRFFASGFMMFGLALLWCTRDLHARKPTLHFLLLTFFVGGLARLVSLFATGWPHPMFIPLALVELLLPPLAWWLAQGLSGTDSPTTQV